MSTAASGTSAQDLRAGGPAVARLQTLMRHRDQLRPMYRLTFDHLAARASAEELECWAGGVLDLVDVNAGPTCLIAYWSVSRSLSPTEGLLPLIAAAHATANICRHAGARAAATTIQAFAVVRRKPALALDLPRWWRSMEHLAREAPESVEAAASRMGEILLTDSFETLEHFIAAGLKWSSGNTQRRQAFFSLQEELARRLVERSSAGAGFAETERPTKAFVTALWGSVPLLRPLPIESGQTSQRRSAIAGRLIRLPEFYRGVAANATPALYRAAAAHAQAHLVYGGPRFAIGTLKPLQVALVTLIEDARIETLAMRELPGLRRLWSPYHVAAPAGISTAPALLARLARSLFDPDFIDDDGFIAKGRRLFAAARHRIEEAAVSREIGMLLGNDLGQLRVQFNPKTYVVEPIYRDDGLGLWDFGENAPPSGDVIELNVEAARPDKQHGLQGEPDPDSPTGDDATGRARPAAADQRGAAIATYPEWDRAQRSDRPDWTTVREVPARQGDPRIVERALEDATILRSRIQQLVRGVRVGRTIRLKRQIDGHDLDLDAMLDAGIALRIGQEPDPRVFRSSTSKLRDLAVLLLIDTSESTRDKLASGTTILDVERLAVAILAEAMSALGDPFCLLGFASNGRDNVEVTNVKAFSQSYDRACTGRLAGLSSGLSTRLGTALRHAGETIRHARNFRKLVIVLTDGEPSDIDTDPRDLVEDASHAALILKNQGIDAFGVVLNSSGMSAARRIFGRGNTMLVHRVEDLPSRLSEVYFRLARR